MTLDSIAAAIPEARALWRRGYAFRPCGQASGGRPTLTDRDARALAFASVAAAAGVNLGAIAPALEVLRAGAAAPSGWFVTYGRDEGRRCAWLHVADSVQLQEHLERGARRIVDVADLWARAQARLAGSPGSAPLPRAHRRARKSARG